MFESIAAAYLFLFPPVLIALFFLKGSRKKLLINFMSVIHLTMIAYSFFLIRQLIGLWQLANGFGISPFKYLISSEYLLELSLIIILPFLFFVKPLLANRTLGFIIWSLLLVCKIYPELNDQPILILCNLLFYLSLVCALYALLWLLKKLPEKF